MAMASTSASALASCSRAFSTLKSGGKAIARGKQAARAVAVAGNSVQASRIHSSRSLRYMPESSEFPDGQPRAQSTLFQPEPTKVANHLNSLMQGLQPPISSELAMRMVTHKGAVSQITPLELSQHNARLSFLGRRILRLYLSIFLHAHASLLEKARSQASASSAASTSSSASTSTKLSERLLDETLNTYSLGRYVATRWQLEHNMRWMQLVNQHGRPSGFGKVSGQAVEAIMGGIFRQYGAAVALQVFNSRVLPFLDLPEALRKPSVQLAKAHSDLSPQAQSALRQQMDQVMKETEVGKQ